MARYIDLDKVKYRDVILINGALHKCVDKFELNEMFDKENNTCENCLYFKEITFNEPWAYAGMCRWFNTHAVCKNDFCSRYESKNG